MKRSIPGLKNEDGMYISIPTSSITDGPSAFHTELPSPDVSLDDIGKRIIVAMDRATKTLLTNITAGDVSRETIGSLKDCAAVYKDLRKDEKELLDDMTDEDIAKQLKK